MHDSDKCTPPRRSFTQADGTPWTELAPLREVFLQYVGRKKTRKALRYLGDLFYQMVLEFRAYDPPDNRDVDDLAIEAVSRDLLHLAAYLRYNVAEIKEDTPVSQLDDIHAQKAFCWGKELERIAGEMGEFLKR